MSLPLWLEQIPTTERGELAAEFGQLVEYVAQATASPEHHFTKSRLGMESRYLLEPDARRRLALAMLTGLDASGRANDRTTRSILQAALVAMLRRDIPFVENDLGRLLSVAASGLSGDERLALLPGVVNAVQRTAGSRPLAPEHRQLLLTIRQVLVDLDEKRQKAAGKVLTLIDKLCDDSVVARLQPDEGWADDLRQWVLTLDSAARASWEELLRDAASVCPEPPVHEWRVSLQETGLDCQRDMEAAIEASHQLQRARLPASVWQQRMREHLQTIGLEAVRDRLQRSLHKVHESKPGPLARQSLNRELLRGLLWLAVDVADGEVAQAVQHATRFFFENDSPLGEAGVVVLYHMPGRTGAASLAAILNRVRAQTQRAFLESTIRALATRLGVDRDELIDDSLPTFGFTELGQRTWDFGEARAELQIVGSRGVQIVWSKPDGKVVKSVPAKVKREHADEVESVKATAAGVREALSGLALRLESWWLAQRTFSIGDWHARLIAHPVAGVLGRTLIWQVGSGEEAVTLCPRGDGFTDARGQSVRLPAEATLMLWHPLDATPQDVLAWRERLEADGACQPFKQAHREIYLLTDAERGTRTYSNRFAAHIIRQSQFRQLAKTRGWQVGLLGPWDSGDEGAAQRDLPHWGLRAEFWLDGVPGEYQTGFTYLSTDQVRFCRSGRHEPLPLQEIPAIVFTEVMRDVDLFVGVASVGNDPDWQDRSGEGRRFREYWHDYSFGQLSAVGETRKTVLMRLIPRLKIAPRCTFADRFLVVRGDLRTYKIHFGSGNVLMLPNDQCLCVVPLPNPTEAGPRIWLPFEGDHLLSVILSKAFLLAEDSQITDATISGQIRAGLDQT